MYSLIDSIHFRVSLFSVDMLAQQSRDRLICSLLENTNFKKSIGFTSPELLDEIERLKLSDNSLIYKALSVTLMGYALRSCCRTTPLGLFSGIGGGVFLHNHNSSFQFSPDEVALFTRESTRSRLSNIREMLERREISGIKFAVRQDSLVVGKYIRFYTHASIDSDEECVVIERTEILDTLMSKAGNFMYLSDAISDVRQNYPELELEDVKSYFFDLIDVGLFIVSTDEELIGIYRKGKVDLDRIETDADKIDVFVEISPRTAIVNLASAKNVVDLNNRLMNLWTLPMVNLRVAEFEEKFKERYEFNPVDLLEAFDDYMGIGHCYPSSPKFRRQSEATSPRREILDVFRNMILNSASVGSRIDLEKALPLNQAFEDDKLPDSLDYMLSIFKKSVSDSVGIDQDVLLLNGIGGIEPMGVLSNRFQTEVPSKMNLLQNNIYDNQDVMYADVIYTAMSDRVNGLVIGQSIRKNSLNFVDPGKGDIHLKNLKMKYVRDTGIILYDSEHDKRIIFMPSDTVAVPHRPRVVQFLLDISRSITRYPVVPALHELGKINYIPETYFRNIIIYPESWRLPEELRTGLSSARFCQAFQDWVKSENLPRMLTINHEERKLTIDVHQPLDLEVLRKHVSSYPPSMEFFLSKSMFLDYEPLAEDDMGKRYATDVCISMALDDVRHRPISIRRPTENSNRILDNIFNVKIFCMPEKWMEIIVEIYEFILEYNEEQLCPFYITYDTPNFHIRLRFLYPHNPNKLYGLMMDLLTGMRSDGLISVYQIEPFQAEEWRYGGSECYQTALRCFEKDSELCVELIKLINGRGMNKIIVAVISVVNFLAVFESEGLDVESTFRSLSKSMNHKDEAEMIYVSYFKGIRSAEIDELNYGVKNLFNATVASYLEKYIVELGRMRTNLSLSKQDLVYALISITHMHCNRLGLSNGDEDKVYYICRRLTVADKYRRPKLEGN